MFSKHQIKITIDPDVIEGLKSINCIKGSLIWQTLEDGTLIGGDYDGRLGPLTLFINNLDIIKDAFVLDLGSNAGHFPIEYIRAGAKSVIAVEGRNEFKSQFVKIKDQIPGVDTDKIDWVTCDVKDYIPDREYNIISCLGLAYHIEDFWPMLVAFAMPCVEYIIFETSLMSTTKYMVDLPDDRTNALERSKVLRMGLIQTEHTLRACFPGYDMKRIWAIHYPDNRVIIANTFPGQRRGLWLLSKKH